MKLCRRRWTRREPLPTDASLDVVDTLSQLREQLEATRPERDAQREDARQTRRRAEEIVERNHFGESMQKAMERRR